MCRQIAVLWRHRRGWRLPAGPFRSVDAAGPRSWVAIVSRPAGTTADNTAGGQCARRAPFMPPTVSILIPCDGAGPGCAVRSLLALNHPEWECLLIGPGPVLSAGDRRFRHIQAAGSRPHLYNRGIRSDEHKSELQSPSLISYAVFCLNI